MTEEQIEIVLERRMNKLDERYLANQMTDEEYSAAVRQLEKEAKELATQ